MIYTSMKDLENWVDKLPDEYKSNYNRLKRFSEVLTTEPEPLVGQTPKEVIWTKNKSKLYRYQPAIKKTNKVPILMVYALINKPYILDLAPGNSLIEYLTNQGHDVYLLDWGTAGYEDRHMKLEDYIMDYIPRATKKVLQTSNAKELSVLGYCMGGTMTSIFAALHPELPIRNLIFMTSPFDFADAGHYTNWLDKRYFNLDKLVDTMGNITPEFIDFGNKLLNPIQNFYGPYVSLADRADNETFVEGWKLMQKWLKDGIPFPGESYRQWIGEFYQENKLINDELYVRGRQVKLGDIKANVLNIAGSRDNIALPHQVEALNDKISSKNKTFHLLETGHVSVTVGRTAINETYPLINEWLVENSK
ncbi:class III poly(R)-hydroxyalkanoic acid synthase subunit PhaC [Sporosarcina pasteurii]|uniref:Poly(3-hydroxyalkanoate) polymerase subunit PhaC n=1 Tax=Sporosarcina pasteurii TaxID=1474 RepID=A0A380C0R5_SPOPA|nr:class III poly(R)-hydroxyalkanoic acid synthase subunit PhaC [Sporosarcina pasteurii]MDS9471446.1 class III poly(R)-hydroxyalkanoic acid synthase subunit PhaC [Sporosarcina pasteurii]QBQ04931.1 class III poly(R)-hydroxyalkanoic acid synthase subunit PhaC [Sporosarcina pasteurii]SUJ10062.1 Poly-beta-hydroxybutyrate polymerase [Sporosarcina pasteurii]